MTKPIVNYISLKSVYQMNPTPFIIKLLKSIEKRNDVKVSKNNAGQDVMLYGVTADEKQTIDLFKGGNLNPKSFSGINEEIQKSIKEGLNLQKKVIPLNTVPKGSNADVINHFTDQSINSNIKSWGTTNVKIVKYPNGFGLMNYSTLLAFKDLRGTYYINSQKYSSSTNKVQYTLRNLISDKHPEDKIKYVTEAEIYEIANVRNDTTYYPYLDKKRVQEIVSKVIDKKLTEGLNLNTDRKNNIQTILKNL